MPNLGRDAGESKKDLDRKARIDDTDEEHAADTFRRHSGTGAGKLLDAKPIRPAPRAT